MKKLQGREDYARFSVDSAQFNTRGLMRAGMLSLLLHVVLVVLLTFGLKPYTPKERLSIYRVTLRPFAPSGAIQSVNPGGRSGGPSPSQPTEQMKPNESSKVSKVGEKPKPDEKPEKPEKGGALQSFKKEKVYERWKKAELEASIRSPSKKEEKPKKERESDESLQEALADVRKKIALDNIQKRVERRTEGGKSGGGQKAAGQKAEGQPPVDSSQSQGGSSSKGGIASASGTGTGSAAGIGSGSGGYPIGGVPWGSPLGSSVGSSKLTDYYDMIWAKIKREWVLPGGDILKGKTDLETIVVIQIERDGKIKKSWFEKRSGNILYDQSTMRAIKKADPLLPLPKELSDTPFEIGIRFYPE
jgi:TonB family protein